MTSLRRKQGISIVLTLISIVYFSCAMLGAGFTSSPVVAAIYTVVMVTGFWYCAKQGKWRND